MKVAAVVVTYNRKKLLQECLEALLNQTRPLDVVYVIDNASTDGTHKLLAETGLLEHPLIKYIPLPTNLGGAGGFHAGMKIASEEGNEWIWVMDDDGIPSHELLSNLLKYIHFPDVVAVAGRLVRRIEDLETHAYIAGHRQMLRRDSLKRPYTRLFMSSFVGLLISKKAIELIGLPRSEFFIHCDDYEYCVRLRAIGDIAWAPGPAILHKEAAGTWPSRFFLGKKAVRPPVERYAYLYYLHRNTAWTMTHTRQDRITAIRELIIYFLLESIKITFWDRKKLGFRFHVLFKAFSDGLRSNFDNDFPKRTRIP